MFLMVLMTIGLIIWMFFRKEQARRDYQNALTEMRHYPDDADRYQAALRAAETLADRTRPKHSDRETWRSSVRNEVELIKLQTTKAEPVSTVESVESRLHKLSDLHFKGLITQEEFSQRRQEILDEI